MARPSIGETLFEPEVEKSQREREVRLKLSEILKWMDRVRVAVDVARKEKTPVAHDALDQLQNDPRIPELVRNDLFPIFTSIDDAMARQVEMDLMRSGEIQKDAGKLDRYSIDLAAFQAKIIRFLAHTEHPSVNRDLWKKIEALYGSNAKEEFEALHSGVIGALAAARFFHEHVGLPANDVLLPPPEVDVHQKVDLVAYAEVAGHRPQMFAIQVKGSKKVSDHQWTSFRDRAIDFDVDVDDVDPRNRQFARGAALLQKQHPNVDVVPLFIEVYQQKVGSDATKVLIDPYSGVMDDDVAEIYGGIWDVWKPKPKSTPKA